MKAIILTAKRAGFLLEAVKLAEEVGAEYDLTELNDFTPEELDELKLELGAIKQAGATK